MKCVLSQLLRLQKKEHKSGFEISSSQYEKGPTVIYIILSVSRAGFLNLGIIILSQIIFCYTVLLNCRMFSSIPGFYPAESRNTCDYQKCLQKLPGSPRGTPPPCIANEWQTNFNAWEKPNQFRYNLWHLNSLNILENFTWQKFNNFKDKTFILVLSDLLQQKSLILQI